MRLAAVRSDGLATRAALLVGAALLLSVLVLPWRPPTLCLLRAVTGVPCPFCGGTTAMVQLGRGDLLAALQASPLLVLAAPLWVCWPRLRAAASAWSSRHGRRASLLAGACVLTASELWQLHRFAG